MTIITKDFLEELGINLNDQDYQSLKEHFENTLFDHIVHEITEELTPEQTNKLSDLQNSDDATILDWLKANIPDLHDIASDEIDILIGEIAENGDAINKSA